MTLARAEGRRVNAERGAVGSGLRFAVQGRLSRLPLRARLVAGFVVAITLVLSAAGTFVYWRVAYALDLRLNDDLRAQAAALDPLVTTAGSLRADPELDRIPGARQYQVLDDQGRVLSWGSELGPTPLLSAEQARAAVHDEVVANIGKLLSRNARPLRLLTVPIQGPGPARVLLIGDRRDGRDEALRELVAQLLVAGLGALIVSALVGERLAKAALAPVERYRTKAASIAAGASGIRLDVPPGRDDEVTRLGHTLNEVLDALEQALERERRFTQDASHELRTPLTLLKTGIELALRRPRTADEHEATLRELQQDVAQLSALTDQLLSLSTSDVAPLTSDSPGGDLAATAAGAVKAHQAHRPDGAATVTFLAEPADVALPVAMNEPQLGQILTNLIGNAIVHGQQSPVRVRVRSSGGAAVLTVSDDGPGMPPSFLPAAADRFARADVARGRPGAGLGLSLVRDLVERAGGELRLCSSGAHHRYADPFPEPCAHPTTGTTVSVLLPML